MSAPTENLLITDWRTEIPLTQRAGYETGVFNLAKSLNCSHDRIRKLTDTNNQLVGQVVDLQKRLDRANLKIWIMSLIVSPIIAAVLKAMWSAIFR